MPRLRSLACVLWLTLSIGATAAENNLQISGDIVYGHKDGLALTLDVLRPADSNGGGLIFLVSGGWYSRWAPTAAMVPLFQPYLDEGYTVFAVRHGSSPRYSIPEAVADVRRAVRFIRLHAADHGVDPDRLAVMGMSAGGHLSLVLGTTADDGDADADDPVLRTSSRVATVIALVPPTDLRIMTWDAPDSLPAYKQFPALHLDAKAAAENSPLLFVSKDDVPALVIVGSRDELVPPSHGQRIQEAYQQHGVASKLVVLEGAGHGLAGKHLEQAVEEILAWLKRHLSP